MYILSNQRDAHTQTHTHAHAHTNTVKRMNFALLFLKKILQIQKLSLKMKDKLETSACKRGRKTRLVLYLTVNNLKPPTVGGKKSKTKAGSCFEEGL